MKKNLLAILLFLSFASAFAAISTDKTTYSSADPVKITWDAADASAKDWIGIYPVGVVPGSSNPSVEWDYVSTSAGTMNFPNRMRALPALPAGQYVAILLCCDGYTIKSTSLPFTVSGAVVSDIKVNKASFIGGENIVFTYSGGTGSPKDWIGIYKTGEKPGTISSTLWKYVPSASGKLTIQNTTNGGTYRAYLFCCDGYNILDSTDIFTTAPALKCTTTASPAIPAEITKIGFGSCASQNKPQPTIEVAASKKPDFFIYLGDNMYADTYDTTILKQKYQDIYYREEFCKLKSATKLLATWDDHDYGNNDEDRDYPHKVKSQKIFNDFWEEPANSPRRTQEGIYTSYQFGTTGKRVQVIILDTRYFLSNRRPNTSNCGKNDYCPHTDTSTTILGKTQWKWLEQQLLQPADLRIIASSIPFGVEYNGWETWANFPHERARFTDLVKSTKAEGIIFISGDVHYSEISNYSEAGIPLIDFTSSGINNEWLPIEPNKFRVPNVPATHNQSVGFMDINWTNKTVKLASYGATGNELLSHTVSLDSLKTGVLTATHHNDTRTMTERLIISPNPALGDVNLDFQVETDGKLQIVNLEGKKVKEMDIRKGKHTTTLTGLEYGMYIVYFRTNNNSMNYVDKLIISK